MEMQDGKISSFRLVSSTDGQNKTGLKFVLTKNKPFIISRRLDSDLREYLVPTNISIVANKDGTATVTDYLRTVDGAPDVRLVRHNDTVEIGHKVFLYEFAKADGPPKTAAPKTQAYNKRMSYIPTFDRSIVPQSAGKVKPQMTPIKRQPIRGNLTLTPGRKTTPRKPTSSTKLALTPFGSTPAATSSTKLALTPISSTPAAASSTKLALTPFRSTPAVTSSSKLALTPFRSTPAETSSTKLALTPLDSTPAQNGAGITQYGGGSAGTPTPHRSILKKRSSACALLSRVPEVDDSSNDSKYKTPENVSPPPKVVMRSRKSAVKVTDPDGTPKCITPLSNTKLRRSLLSLTTSTSNSSLSLRQSLSQCSSANDNSDDEETSPITPQLLNEVNNSDNDEDLDQFMQSLNSDVDEDPEETVSDVSTRDDDDVQLSDSGLFEDGDQSTALLPGQGVKRQRDDEDDGEEVERLRKKRRNDVSGTKLNISKRRMSLAEEKAKKAPSTVPRSRILRTLSTLRSLPPYIVKDRDSRSNQENIADFQNLNDLDVAPKKRSMSKAFSCFNLFEDSDNAGEAALTDTSSFAYVNGSEIDVDPNVFARRSARVSKPRVVYTPPENTILSPKTPLRKLALSASAKSTPYHNRNLSVSVSSTAALHASIEENSYIEVDSITPAKSATYEIIQTVSTKTPAKLSVRRSKSTNSINVKNLTLDEVPFVKRGPGRPRKVNKTMDEAGLNYSFGTPVASGPKTPKAQTVAKCGTMTRARSMKNLMKTPMSDVKTPLVPMPRNVGDVKQLFKTPKANKEPHNELSNVQSVMQVMKTPKLQSDPINDVNVTTGVKKLLQTPKANKTLDNDLSDARGVKLLLNTSTVNNESNHDLADVQGVKQLINKPKAQKEPLIELTDIGVKKLLQTPKVNAPTNDLTDVHGVKQLLKTPKQQKEPLNDLTDIKGVKKLLQTPKVNNAPTNDLTDVRGVKQLLKTPKQQKEPLNDLTDIKGVKKLLQTPKVNNAPTNDLTDVRGVKQLLKTPKPQKDTKKTLNDLTDIKGVKKLMQTPRAQNSPKNDLTGVQGVKELLRTPKQAKPKRIKVPQAHNSPKNDLTNIKGLKELMQSPKVQNSPKNDLTRVQGVKELLKTPKQAKPKRVKVPQTHNSPKNDLTNIKGLKKLMQSPKVQNSPKNDLTRVQGVKELLKTPKQAKPRRVKVSRANKSPKNDITDVRGVRQMFNSPRIQQEPTNDLMDISGIDHLFESSDDNLYVVANSRTNDDEVEVSSVEENVRSMAGRTLRPRNKVVPQKKFSPDVITSATKTTRRKKIALVNVSDVDAVEEVPEKPTRKTNRKRAITQENLPEAEVVVKKTRGRKKAVQPLSPPPAPIDEDEDVDEEVEHVGVEAVPATIARSRKDVNEEPPAVKKTRGRKAIVNVPKKEDDVEFITVVQISPSTRVTRARRGKGKNEEHLTQTKDNFTTVAVKEIKNSKTKKKVQFDIDEATSTTGTTVAAVKKTTAKEKVTPNRRRLMSDEQLDDVLSNTSADLDPPVRKSRRTKK